MVALFCILMMVLMMWMMMGMPALHRRSHDSCDDSREAKKPDARSS